MMRSQGQVIQGLLSLEGETLGSLLPVSLLHELRARRQHLRSRKGPRLTPTVLHLDLHLLNIQNLEITVCWLSLRLWYFLTQIALSKLRTESSSGGSWGSMALSMRPACLLLPGTGVCTCVSVCVCVGLCIFVSSRVCGMSVDSLR